MSITEEKRQQGCRTPKNTGLKTRHATTKKAPNSSVRRVVQKLVYDVIMALLREKFGQHLRGPRQEGLFQNGN